MTQKRIYVTLFVILSLCAGCSCNQKEKTEIGVPAVKPTSLSEMNNDFAFRLYNKVEESGENLFYSPYSISSALSMVWGGAKGQTADQIAGAMSFNLPPEEHHAAFRDLQLALNEVGKRDKAQLSVANALFGAEKHKSLLLKDYLNLLRESYASDLYSLDFGDAKGTSAYINRWVEEKTKERIKNLITEDHIRNSNDGLVLVNAIYFKGNWLKQFNPKSTLRDKFYTSFKDKSEENARPVEMMHSEGDFAYGELHGLQLLELPYAEKDLAMLIALPEDIGALQKGLSAQTLKDWQSALQTQEVKVYLPKLKLSLTLEKLTKALKEMGMTDAFDSTLADFTGIRQPGAGADLYIMDIVHKAFVEMNEEGTEAAAATGVVMATKAAPSKPVPVFRADHPFIFMIIHKPSNSVLFLGRLSDPRAS